jgi:hypothetical protein
VGNYHRHCYYNNNNNNNYYNCARLKVTVAAITERPVFSVITPSVVAERCQCFGGIFCLHLQGSARIRDWTTLKMESVSFSRTLVTTYQSNRRHVIKYWNLSCYCYCYYNNKITNCHLSSPLHRKFTITYLKKNKFLKSTILQLVRGYNLWYM